MCIRDRLEIWGHLHVFTGPDFAHLRRQFAVHIGRRTVYLDLADEATMVAIELDGAAYHDDTLARERDRRRDALLATLGWLTLRFSSRRLRREPGAARREALQTMAERRPPGGSGALLAPLPLGRLPWHQRRVDVLQHDLASDHASGDVLAARDVVHHREQDLLQDGAQAARPGAAQDGLVGDRLQRVLTELQLHAIELEKASVLADQGVLRLGQDADQRLPIQLVHTRDHRQPADELWDHAVLEQVLRHHVGDVFADVMPED